MWQLSFCICHCCWLPVCCVAVETWQHKRNRVPKWLCGCTVHWKNRLNAASSLCKTAPCVPFPSCNCPPVFCAVCHWAASVTASWHFFWRMKQGSPCILRQYAAESGASQLEDSTLPREKKKTLEHTDWFAALFKQTRVWHCVFP